MEIEYDATKDQSNMRKHGVSLADATSLDWDSALEAVDSRNDYGEERMIAYAPIGERLYCAVYVDRGDVRRVISFRKANAREVERYEEAQAGQADA